jgi:hypothetical protein
MVPLSCTEVYQKVVYSSSTQFGNRYLILKTLLVMPAFTNSVIINHLSNSKNIPFYERYGFEVLGTIQINTSPAIFPVLRKPLNAEKRY